MPLSPESLGAIGGSLRGPLGGTPPALSLTPEQIKLLVEQAAEGGGGPGFAASVQDAGLGVLGHALDFISHPGQAFRSALSVPAELLNGDPMAALGRAGDALEHGLEFGADLMTGGMASHAYKELAGEDFTTQAESPEFTDLLQSYTGGNKLGGGAGFAADVIGGALTDPLTLLTGGGGALAGVGRQGLTGATRAGARSLLSRSLVQTTKGQAGLLKQLGGQASDDILRALDTGSLKGLMESSLKLVDDASEQMLLSRMAGPVNPSDALFKNTANAGLLDDAMRGLADEGMVKLGGFRVGLPFGQKHHIDDVLAKVGIEANTGARPWALGGVARHGAAPAVAGEAVAGALGLPAGAGMVGGIAGNAIARKVAPGAMTKVDNLIDGAWSKAVTGVYSKFQDLKIPKQVQETARQFWNRKQGADRESLEFTRKVFDGVSPEQRRALFEAMGEVETQAGKGSPEALRSMAALRGSELTGLPVQRTQQLMDEAFRAFDAQQDELVGLGVWKDQGRRFYVPHVMNPALAERFADKGLDAHELFKPQAFKDSFTRARRSKTVEEFEKAVQKRARQEGVSLDGIEEIAVRDLGDLLHTRQLAHNETMWKHGLKSHMEEFAGASRALDADTAIDNYVRNLTAPMGGRNIAERALAAVNRLAKPLQTVYFPAFHARNAVSTWAQVLLDPAMGIKDSAKVMAAQVGDLPLIRALSKKVAGREQHRVYKFLEAVNNPTSEAAQKAAGSIRIGRYTGDEVLRYAKQGIVQNNFGEEILEQLGIGAKALSGGETNGATKRFLAKVGIPVRGLSTNPDAGTLRKIKGWVDKTATDVSAYIEDRARLTTFVGMLDQGIPAEEAISRVQRAFVNYDVQSGLDRTLRDIVPYARFMTGNTPVVLKEVAKRPGLLSAQARAAESVQRSDPLAPRDARLGMGVPLGGNSYLTGLGLPQAAAADVVDGLTSLDGARRMLASTNMGISGPLQKVTNRNLYFGGDFDRPSAAPDWLPSGLGLVNDTAYGGKEFSPGVSQALFSSPVGRFTGAARTLDDDAWGAVVSKFVTGFGVRTTDEERGIRSVVNSWLEDAHRKGEVGKFNSFFQRGTSPEAEEAVRFYLGMRKAERARRAAEKASK